MKSPQSHRNILLCRKIWEGTNYALTTAVLKLGEKTWAHAMLPTGIISLRPIAASCFVLSKLNSERALQPNTKKQQHAVDNSLKDRLLWQDDAHVLVWFSVETCKGLRMTNALRTPAYKSNYLKRTRSHVGLNLAGRNLFNTASAPPHHPL